MTGRVCGTQSGLHLGARHSGTGLSGSTLRVYVFRPSKGEYPRVNTVAADAQDPGGQPQLGARSSEALVIKIEGSFRDLVD